ncbi:MAG: ABC-F family ATP-binding cassette domain-containing protein [Microbacterium sp.]|jgi:ABC transport system ATP-binding/permease protein|uniref:ABC-F family ATP-binding cassette domain-containing protein n=1 Tax=Microbacterium TaxID=33882 RepID=UPI000ECA6485|nr:ABC-F family ATP-binding cassette domain-containing protein [Microbacterium schleiferi]MEC8762878.1 ABC-F family ATP-binding cassette domain-containing protein [Actinomycetota bacterium]HAM13840.1 ABC transporter ATP-binding protein [Microbacterium sp.]MCC4266490.1 ABC-F family ATP-binding cassette domain-containing protein [Microbacterium schleiferi]HCM49632.1 ABC transporter ATP-binding protein [Microbacterium sp.]HIE61227.1 ABC transporter ATP-binding protein [Microbacterium sp.]|tara:strand:- start:25 stop:1842 length:1818 start_codon:yes stop_codon:yes gene_type:complete
MAHLLGAESLHLEFPTKVVFDSVTLGIAEGDRIGIVGRNGDGKSSLLAMIAGRLEPDAGKVTVRGGTRIGVVDQQDTLDDNQTVGRAIVGDLDEHEWAGDARIRDVLAGLVTDLDWNAPLSTLSGGQRRRVALAAVLIGGWDVLILDEPTNHLDVEGIAWLAAHLKKRWTANAGALLVVTHDRWFLDEVCTLTWEVHDRIVEPFEGGYAAYILQRVERDRQAAAIEARRQNLARKELAWLRRGAPARTSKPKFRIDAANALIADVPEIRNSTELQSLAVTRLGKDVVDLLDASVSFDGREILRDIEWRIAPGERTGILGVNGAGKSTLLGLVDGSVSPTGGRVKRGKTVRVATLTQRLDELEQHLADPVRVVIGGLRTSYTIGSGSKAQELTPGQLLERLGFSSAQLSTPVRDLSGGQKRRLQLLLILLDQPNVLILDEPTNDLDTDMLAAMEDLLDSWPGTLLVVSHDRYFLERVTDQQYAILPGPGGAGRLRHLPGGVDEYLRLREQTTDAGPDRSGAASAAQQTSEPGLSGADLRAAQKELSAIERKLERLTQRTAEIHERMAAHDQSDFAGLTRLGDELREVETETASLEERWFELTELAT